MDGRPRHQRSLGTALWKDSGHESITFPVATFAAQRTHRLGARDRILVALERLGIGSTPHRSANRTRILCRPRFLGNSIACRRPRGIARSALPGFRSNYPPGRTRCVETHRRKPYGATSDPFEPNRAGELRRNARSTRGCRAVQRAEPVGHRLTGCCDQSTGSLATQVRRSIRSSNSQADRICQSLPNRRIQQQTLRRAGSARRVPPLPSRPTACCPRARCRRIDHACG